MDMDAKLVAELKAKGMAVVEPDKALWSKALQSVYKEFEPVVGKAAIESLINAQK